MTGSPLRSALWVCLAYALLVIPLYWVTQSRGIAQQEEPGGVELTEYAAVLLLRAAHPWQSLSVSVEGAGSWDLAAGEQEAEIDFVCTRDVFLVVQGQWGPEVSQTALRIEVQPEYLETQEHTFWGGQSWRDEAHFVWSDE